MPLDGVVPIVVRPKVFGRSVSRWNPIGGGETDSYDDWSETWVTPWTVAH